MKYIARSLIIALGLLSSVASAQWQWLDKDGRKMFSDRAPPSDVPDKNIIKRPGQPKVAAETVNTNTEGTQSDVSAAKPALSASKPTGIDKELAEKKKQADLVEAAKQKAVLDKVQTARKENCERAKAAKAGIDSGIRISRTNKAGEREILDDAARAGESKRVQSIIDADCK